jgi:UDP-N-acetylmuramate dehydrogenase
MNAGAFGSTISNNLIEVKVMDLSSGELKKYKKNQLKFRHRYSSFQENNRLFILEASFQVAQGSKKVIVEKMRTCRKYRLETQPIDCYTLGSVFKRTIFNGEEVSAGLLLEKAGCKKMKVGEAEVSQKHANFIINREKATTKDILSLISRMKKSVKNKFGVDLELEIRII